jgi:hypothetical protein
MKRQLLLAVILMYGLAACESLYQDDHARPAPAKSQVEPEPAPAPPIPAPPPRRPRPKLPAASTDTAITIVGLSRPDLINLLGEPAERTDRNAGQTWVYHSGSCTLEVLFLFDMTRNEMFAVDRKLSGIDATPRAEQQCLQHLKAAAHAS